MAVARIPILILTDCEPDSRLVSVDEPSPWIGFERFYEFLSTHRDVITARTGAPAYFSWFWRMDRQIELSYGSAEWPIRTHAQQIADAERHGDEIGLHTHAWRWDQDRREWIADHGSSSVVEACVRESFAAFEAAFGRTCRIFRFGDGWIDEPTLQLVEKLGARIDLTIEPGQPGVPSLVSEERSTGSIPDRRGAPTHPYRPSRCDFRRPDALGETRIWAIPVTTGTYRRRSREIGSRLRLQTWRDALKRRTLTLNLGAETQLFAPVFDRTVSSGDHSYAAITVRSDVGSDAGLTACVDHNLRCILNHPLARRFAFVTPSEALGMLVDATAGRSPDTPGWAG